MRKFFKIHHRCGHVTNEMIDDGNVHALAATKNALMSQPCPRCACGASAVTVPVATSPAVAAPVEHLHIDPTTPAGAQLGVVNALQHGWTEDEIVAGVRFGGEPTFVCAGCGRTFPQRLAMSASLGTSCPDCFDDLAG